MHELPCATDRDGITRTMGTVARTGDQEFWERVENRERFRNEWPADSQLVDEL